MYRVAIAEDSAFERKQLTEYLRRYEKEKGVQFDILEFSDGDELIAHYPENPDILFMDIVMEHMDGLKAARLVRRRDERVVLIFVTNMVQYAVRGYSVDALDFMVKPLSYTGLKVRLDRAIRKLSKSTSRQITIQSCNEHRSIPISDICYIETDNHHVILHTKEQAIPVNASMKSFEKDLSDLPFFRCHASFLINLKYIDKIQGNNVWVNGTLLSVSRYRRKEFLDAWGAYLGE